MDERDSLGLNGGCGGSGRKTELLGSLEGRKDWRLAAMDGGSGTAIVSDTMQLGREREVKGFVLTACYAKDDVERFA